uniref:WWE domain-containing protein n=1 Tax=Steinernema glaseri TaxID=37863 RepID=A0A1I7YJF2_9BILA
MSRTSNCGWTDSYRFCKEESKWTTYDPPGYRYKRHKDGDGRRIENGTEAQYTTFIMIQKAQTFHGRIKVEKQQVL